jgi:hypothetical protein
VVVAQKLLHRICPHCKTEYKPSQNIIQRLNISAGKLLGSRFFKGTGCRECNQTGTYGRSAVYETMIITPSLKDVIMEGGTEMAIKRVARLEGMRTLREMALELAMQGQSTLEEVIYVTPSDEEEKRIPLAGLTAAGLGGGSYIMPIQMQPMSAAMQPDGMAQFPVQQQSAPKPRPSIDLNDPVTKTIIASLQKEYLFFSDEKLADRLHLPVIQVRELMHIQHLERNKDGFARHFGNQLEELSENDIADIIGMISDKQGEIPAFIFEEEQIAEIWARQSVRHALEKMKTRLHKPEDLPELFNEQFINASGLDQAYLWADRSRFKLVELAIPGKFKPWQFGETEMWLTGQTTVVCAREAIEWLMSENLAAAEVTCP